MEKVKQNVFLWVPVIIWCGLIFYLSSIPRLRAAENPFWDEIIRSFLHLIIYTILFVLFFRALNALKEKKDYLWPLIFSLFYSLSDEIHQSFIPTRTFQIRDLLVNMSGIFLGGLGIWKLLPRAPAKLKNWAKELQLI
ncbi:MAG TPA: VanZ family protein [Patescibacteria group bacterium]|nr:VanZ family protein [Patescibacteria group bacterium]